MKIAGAPISWGVCEVPGWGPMLPADRVLRELKSLDLNALELGAPGFLPETGPKVHELLQAANVEMLGGFVPVIVHDAAQREATLVLRSYLGRIALGVLRWSWRKVCERHCG